MANEVTLTEGDLCAIRDSLSYSAQRIGDYPHASYEHKRESMRPIKQAIDKVRQLIASRKEAKDGR